MYTVEWCDYEGNQQQCPVDTLEDARLECEYLHNEKQYDGVRILDPNVNEIVSC